ncbi:MAG: hypothetical protein FVQ04_07520 [Nitrospira sp.]|nr:hypothetical protein [Nitrospira sp.]MCH6556791.1 hypothetical protein [Nitrospirota bacterium]MEC4670109.1 hypothetical protein [Nitrospirota bacterium]MEC4686714.1 hypothetical protein [Nitrospirota bacterium]
MQTSQVLDVIGSLVSHLKTFSAKLPELVPMSVVPGGVKPAPEAVEVYEQAVSRFRQQNSAPAYRRLNEPLIESLEAFESGWMLKAVQALLMTLDQIELMQNEKTVLLSRAEEGRLRDYRNALHKILPGSQPELEGSGRGLC